LRGVARGLDVGDTEVGQPADRHVISHPRIDRAERLPVRLDEAVVLVARKRAVEVILAALAVARCHERDVAVDRLSGHDRRDGVVEVETLVAEKLLQAA